MNQCGDCFFWMPGGTVVFPDRGECRRYPPTSIKPLGRAAGEETQAKWPPTLLRQGCGEWQALPAPPRPEPVPDDYGWIEMAKTMPDPERLILVCLRNSPPRVAFLRNNELRSPETGAILLAHTHWQPLPENPRP